MSYCALIEATLRIALADRPFEEPAPGDIAVAAALHAVADCFTMAIPDATRERMRTHLDRAVPGRRFVDGAGHHRPTYEPLAMRWIASLPGTERLIEGFLAAAGSSLRAFLRDESAFLARHGTQAVRNVFCAWAVLSMDAPTEHKMLAREVMNRLVTAQQPDGTFLARTASDNPEPFWYDELALLHALSADAADGRAVAAVARAVAYHVAEVQPDHASSHPWAIAAFMRDVGGRSLADLMLHAAGVQQPSSMDGVSLLLLADALADCGRAETLR